MWDIICDAHGQSFPENNRKNCYGRKGRGTPCEPSIWVKVGEQSEREISMTEIEGVVRICRGNRKTEFSVTEIEPLVQLAELMLDGNYERVEDGRPLVVESRYQRNQGRPASPREGRRRNRDG